MIIFAFHVSDLEPEIEASKSEEEASVAKKGKFYICPRSSLQVEETPEIVDCTEAEEVNRFPKPFGFAVTSVKSEEKLEKKNDAGDVAQRDSARSLRVVAENMTETELQ